MQEVHCTIYESNIIELRSQAEGEAIVAVWTSDCPGNSANNAIRKLTNEIFRYSRRRVNYQSECLSFFSWIYKEKDEGSVLVNCQKNDGPQFCSANYLEGIRLTFIGGEENPLGGPGGPGEPVWPGLPGSPLVPIPWSPWKQRTIHRWSQSGI